MWQKIIYALCIVFSMALANTFAQPIKEFSTNPSDFSDQLSDQFKSNSNEKEEKILTDFLNSWKSDSTFNKQPKEEIITIFNKMLAAKMRPRPHFIQYIQALMLFQTSKHPLNSFQNWTHALNYFLDEPKVSMKSVTDVFSVAIDLLNSNIIFGNASTKWKINGNYNFIFDKGLYVDCNETNLVCLSKRDSIIIYDTRGVFNTQAITWSGTNGTVNWVRSAIPNNEVFAKLGKYTINMSKSEYTADSALLTDKRYFTQPLFGKLEDKVMFVRSSESAEYPQFETYQKDFYIKNIYKLVDYEGGLFVKGSSVIGRGAANQPANLYFFRNDTLRMVTRGYYFNFSKEKVASSSVSVTIFVNRDSIFHPDLSLRYNIKDRQISLLKSDDFTSSVSYSNSYHKLEMNCDQLLWNIDEPEIYFTLARGSSAGKGTFESLNFFDFDRFNRIRGIDVVHPLFAINDFISYYYSDEFPAEAFAGYMKQSINQIRIVLMRLSAMGFLYYDKETEMVKVRQRLYDYINASTGKIDYDVIFLESLTTAPLENALLNMRNFDLTVNGVREIKLSNAQNVVIYPSQNQITFKNNRNFEFNGEIEAGLFSFYGENFFFNYDSFRIDLKNVDSLSVMVETGEVDNYGSPITRRVNNMVQHITGNIEIDKPFNKSGLKDFANYPIFNSFGSSYVFYADKTIQRGAYPKTDFYFEINPFSIDSLDIMKKKSLKFDGKLVSAGIFPDIAQTLLVQSDYSLGFVSKTPSEGLPVYGGKGTYFADINLSNKGLKGNGYLKYITSTSFSQDFNFYPDSMNTEADKFEMEKQTTGVQYPFVKNMDLRIHWLPKEDKMFAIQKKSRFTMLNDTTFLNGNLTLEPIGLSGKGVMDLKVANLSSEKFTYKSQIIDADTSRFDLKSLHTDGFTVQTKDVKSHVDFNLKKGLFNANGGSTYVQFPENKYVSYMDYFIWGMADQKVEMGAKKALSDTLKFPLDKGDEPLIGARYLSVNPQQDSVNFVSPLATYNYKLNVIDATNVKYIDIADSRIFPKDEELTVLSNGKIKPLKLSIIKANKTTAYHNIYDAGVTILNKNKLQASGYADYVAETNEPQKIFFNEIKTDTTGQTIGTGSILEPDNFTLSPYFAYQGKAAFTATKQFYTFDGATRIIQDCDNLNPGWMAFKDELDPLNLYIPVSAQPKDINLNNIFAGIFITSDSIHMYSSFMGKRKNYNDNYIFTASGYLYHNNDSGFFEIASKERLANPDTIGDYFRLDQNKCMLTGEGNINLGVDLGQMKLFSKGKVTASLGNNEYNFDILMGTDFYMYQNSMLLMGKEIDSIPNLKPVDFTGVDHRRKMDKYIGAASFKKLKDEVLLYGKAKELPPPLQRSMVFSKIKLKWNDNTNSFQSYDPLGIGYIKGVQINKFTNGFVEITRKRSGDLMDIYLEPDRSHYYYFGYTRGVMQTLSSNEAFLAPIRELDIPKRRLDVKGNETTYIYMISTDRKMMLFRRRYMNRDEAQSEYPIDDQQEAE